MVTKIPEMQSAIDFVKLYKDQGIESTGAQKVNFTGGLYNVKGSSYDPKKIPSHLGKSWKQLLISYGINNNCYVTNSVGGVHPDFSVGGHMTINRNGSVPSSNICYLMPLCSYHNHTSQDEIKFTHTKTEMLQLTGYMQGELAATFQIRLPSKEPYAILYYSEGDWSYKNLSEKPDMDLITDYIPNIKSEDDLAYVLFERVHEPQIMHYIREINLPEVKN